MNLLLLQAQSFTELFHSANEIGQNINLFIWLVFAVGVIQVLLIALYRTPKLARATSALRDRLNERIGSANFARPRSLAETANLVEDLDQGAVSDSPVAERLRSMLAVRRLGGEPNQSDLSDLTLAVERSRFTLPRYLSGILVLLGLFGTVAGLSAAVGQIRPLLSQSGDGALDLQGVIGALTGTLGGMETAFSTTLTGILTTTILTLLITLAQRHQTSVLARFEGFAATLLVPLFTPVEADLGAAATALVEVGDTFTRMMAGLEAQLGGLTKAVSDGLQTASSRMEATSSVMEANVGDLIAFVRRFQGGVDAFERQAEAGAGLRTQIEGLVKVVENIGKVVTASQAQIDRVLPAMESQNERLKTLNDTLDARFDTLVTSSGAIQLGLGRAANDLADASKRIADNLDATTTQHQKHGEDLAVQFAELMNDVSAKNGDLVAQLEQTMKDAVGQMTTQQKESTGQMTAQQKEAAEQLKAGFVSLDKGLKAVADGVRHVASGPGSTKHTADLLDTLVRQMDLLTRRSLVGYVRQWVGRGEGVEAPRVMNGLRPFEEEAR